MFWNSEHMDQVSFRLKYIGCVICFSIANIGIVTYLEINLSGWNEKNKAINKIFIMKKNSKDFVHFSENKIILDHNLFKIELYFCDNITRFQTVSNINTHHEYYQHLYIRIIKHSDVFDAYLLNFYFDDRFNEEPEGSNYIRTVITIKGPSKSPWNQNTKLNINKFTSSVLNTLWYGYLWYIDHEHPVSVGCYSQSAAFLSRNVNGSYYYQYIITCQVPDLNGILPEYMSVSSEHCSLPTNFKSIVYPELSYTYKSSNISSKIKNALNNKLIGICLQPLYGSLDDSDATYFVSLMELLKILGAYEVTVTNISLILHGININKVFHYYKNNGFLTVYDYPPVHPNINTDFDKMAAQNSVKQLVMSDCFFRKIKKYWYVLIHDFDEVIVPKSKTTYQQYLENYLLQNTSAYNDDCLSVRSAYFYRNLPQEENNFPDYIPLLKYTSRFETEPLGIPNQGGVGMSKSFSKMRSLIAAGSHLCRQVNDKNKKPKQSYLPADEILTHHFRKHCYSIQGDDIRCADNITIQNSILTDKSIHKYSDLLLPKVKDVLSKLKFLH